MQIHKKKAAMSITALTEQTEKKHLVTYVDTETMLVMRVERRDNEKMKSVTHNFRLQTSSGELQVNECVTKLDL